MTLTVECACWTILRLTPDLVTLGAIHPIRAMGGLLDGVVCKALESRCAAREHGGLCIHTRGVVVALQRCARGLYGQGGMEGRTCADAGSWRSTQGDGERGIGVAGWRGLRA